MHVAQVGNFTQLHCTEVHLKRSLEALGCTVTPFQEDAYTPRALSRALADMPALDLLLFTRTWGRTLTHGHLEWLRGQGVPSVSVHLDLYVGIERGGPRNPCSWHNIERDPFWATDWVFSADGDPASQKFFADRGIRHRWLPPAVVADECYLADVPLARDLVFVGSRQYHPEWTWRAQLLDWLAATYPRRCEFYGHAQPGGPIRNVALNFLYASTRMAVGDTLCPGYAHTRYWSDRLTETLGRGGVLLHPRIQGMEDLGFVDGETVITYEYGDLPGLADRIDHYLKHDDEREAIRRAGHQLVKDRHTYTHRMRTVLDTVASADLA